MTSRRTPFTSLLLAAVVAVALLASACSSGGGTTAADDTDTTEAETTTAVDDHDESVAHTHDDDADVVEVSGDLFSYLAAYDESNDNVSISWDDDHITISGNSLPDFETGDFPNSGNPNTISSHDVDHEIALDPVYTGEPTAVKEPGTSLAGIKFDPGTAERDAETGASIEAIQDLLDLGLDLNNAHVQPDGTYHFHGVPTGLVETDETEHSNLVGFMYDGFPVYALYGYGDAETADGTVQEVESSWQLKTGERPDGEPEGTYDGTYTSDYEYVAGSGDLDECNGMFTVTPEYPDGTYAYFVTDTFPFISRCLMGEVDEAATAVPAGPGAGQVPAGTPAQPDLVAAAETLGVAEADLMAALGAPPPDFDAAAAALGVSVTELMAALEPT